MSLRLALAALLALSLAHQDPPIVVSAAISLTDALEEIGRAYERQGGGPVRFNFAASNVLARQIANGAPADIFISADLVQMHHAARAGAVPAASVHQYLLANRLAVVTPAGRSLPGGDAQALTAPSIRRIAIGDPAAVPAGHYAKQFLQHEGLWERLQPTLLPLANVRAALAAVENGGADAAIVYQSDAAASSKVALAFVVPAHMTSPIVYPVAIVEQSRHKEAARRFLSFLRGPEAREIFTRLKFIPYVTTQ